MAILAYQVTNFAYQGVGEFAYQGSIDAVPVGGHGSAEGGEDIYEEPRRVVIRGKAYTVTSKAQYLGLLARGRRDDPSL